MCFGCVTVPRRERKTANAAQPPIINRLAASPRGETASVEGILEEFLGTQWFAGIGSDTILPAAFSRIGRCIGVKRLSARNGSCEKVLKNA